MSDSVCLKVKSNSGQVMCMTVAELIEIDGKPYVPPMEHEDYLEALNLIDGRLERIEAEVCMAAPAEEDSDG